MNIGTVLLARDINELNFLVNERLKVKFNTKCKIVVVDDEVINQKDYIGGSILLPPPQALYRLIDYNDAIGFSNMYYQYLSSPDVQEYITVLMAALFKGIDIILFLNNSDPSLFLQDLMNFLYSNYGIMVFYNTSAFFASSINGAYINNDLNLLTVHGYDINSMSQDSIFHEFGGGNNDYIHNT